MDRLCISVTISCVPGTPFTEKDKQKLQQLVEIMEDFVQREDYELFDSGIEEV